MTARIVHKGFKKAVSKINKISRGTGKVKARAVNRTLTGMRTDAVREIQKEITPKAKVIRSSFKIKKAYQSHPKGSLTSEGRPLNLVHFRARQTKKGVSVQVKKQKKRKLLKHAFIAKLGYKPRVYWRKYKGPRKKVRPINYAALPFLFRFPVKPLHGPRIPDILSNDDVMNRLEEKADERLKKNFNHELKYFLGKL
jgi:hypothetical protein